MPDTLGDKIKELERYIKDGASVPAINKSLENIKDEVESGSLQEKKNYQGLLRIIDRLLNDVVALQAELIKRSKKKELEHVNKKQS